MLLIMLLFSRANWAELTGALSIGYIFGSYHTAPWGVLALAILMVYAKRKQVWVDMKLMPTPVFIASGLMIAVLAFFVPATAPFLMLRLLATCAGAFAIFFGPGAMIPVAMLGAYAFTIYFPLLVETYLDAGYASTSVLPVAWLLRLIGLHIAVNGQVFQFMAPSGKLMSVMVAGACAGPATMAVFVSIFMFMVLDLPLPWQRAVPIFLFGVAGTWLQNVIRIVIILCSGLFWGEKALWTAHFWTIYALFPIWYLLFAMVYFQYVQKPAVA